jgi:hypothetical protein
MSEQYFIQKCITSAEDAKGSYSMMSNLDVDKETKQAYENMVTEISKHLHFLNNRYKYLQQQNQQSGKTEKL